MKKILGLAVILAVLILGSYYGMGIVTERTLKKNIAVINQTNGLFVKVEQYHRGWFRSNVLVNWKLHVPAHDVKNASGVVSTLPAQDFDLQVPLDIYHGPVIFAESKLLFGLGYTHSDVTLPKVYEEKVKQLFTAQSVPPKMSLTVFVNYRNNIMFRMDLPAFKLIDKEGNTQFDWFGLKSDVSISADSNVLSGHVFLDGLHLIKDKINTVLGKVTSDYDLQRSQSGLYSGHASVLSPSFLVSEGDEKLLDVKNIQAQSDSHIEDGLFHSHFKATIDALVSKDKTYGPAVLDISIDKLDADVLAKINSQVNQLQQGTDAERNQMLFSLLPELPKLFAKGASVELKEFSVGMPDGSIKGSFLISIPNAGSSNPFQLIQSIQGDGQLVISAAVLKQLLTDAAVQTLQQQQATLPSSVTPPEATAMSVPDIKAQAATIADTKLTALVASGLLVLQNADYVLKCHLTQGQLLVNNKPFNPAMMNF
jgi:uncharacterized protein YdgA (DUF945 family)